MPNVRVTLTPTEVGTLRDAMAEWASVHMEEQWSGEWERKHGDLTGKLYDAAQRAKS